MTDRELDAPKALTELQRRVLARLFADGGDAPADDVKVSTGMLTEETVRPLADAGYITFTTSRLGRTWLHLTPAGRALFDKLAEADTLDVLKAVEAAPAEMQAMMRKHGLLFEASDDPMAKLAFTLYTELCELSLKARHVIEGVEA
jgi:DNA-binding MarR family transcriptional regulator